ncbi:MAG: 3-phosphoglycerate dehydrogenase [Ruminococcaceae bacterium]|nr:3-phosphoglycerate dehydrogenase [Oscillospiraceae bacterium]
MFDVLTLNKIAPQGLDKFCPEKYTVTDTCENPDGIILRSFSMHDMELPENLKAVARAGAGVNNIPIDACTEKGIVVFNTPGANANAVKELVIAGLLLASRNITGGIEWAKTLIGKGAEVPKLVEKGKGQFVGPELKGKKLGVIGLGAIGVMVANTAHNLGMDVIGYDPYLTIDSAWHLSRSIIKAKDMNEIFANCDYITLHVPLNDSTKNMINSDTLKTMKDGVRILNFSRGGLVNASHLATAIEEKKVACYVTDFPDETVLTMDNVIAIPHLGASTPESEENCAEMAAQELVDYLENGNITNSVNFPSCSVDREGDVRVTILHHNVPTMLSQFSALFAEKHLNILNMMNKNKKETAYTIMDISGAVDDNIEEKLEKIEGVLRVRVLR